MDKAIALSLAQQEEDHLQQAIRESLKSSTRHATDVATTRRAIARSTARFNDRYTGPHEMQQELKCGKHALVNLIANSQSDVEYVSDILSAVECTADKTPQNLALTSLIEMTKEAHFHWWTLAVPAEDFSWVDGKVKVEPKAELESMMHTDGCRGFVVNTGRHWVAIRKYKSNWYLVDSKKRDAPQLTEDEVVAKVIYNKPGDDVYAYAVTTFADEPLLSEYWSCQTVDETNLAPGSTY